jgi:hypothetical protein
MNKWMQRAIQQGTPEFKAYAAYVTEAMPEVTLPVLRDMFKHNASIREYKAHHNALRAALAEREPQLKQRDGGRTLCGHCAATGEPIKRAHGIK